jgi:hypothetical protein
MRYEVVSETGWGQTLYYVYDNADSKIVGNTYMNKYAVQTECDRLNEIEDKIRRYF